MRELACPTHPAGAGKGGRPAHVFPTTPTAAHGALLQATAARGSAGLT